MSLIDFEDFYAPLQRLLPLTNETRAHAIPEQLLNKLLWIEEKAVSKEAKNSQGSCVVDFSGLDPA